MECCLYVIKYYQETSKENVTPSSLAINIALIVTIYKINRDISLDKKQFLTLQTSLAKSE